MTWDEIGQDSTAMHRMGWPGMRPKSHGSGAVVLFEKEINGLFFKERGRIMV